ncbi:MAG TPA: dienelactone hydrolase family protein, partial [Candidatus Acidoferrales bacterium]|nr:dienelactone hydrolase family protein [Candidatus Acidoferrales bacterium]
MRSQILLSAATWAATGSLHAAVQSRTIEYTQAGTPLAGILVWDDSTSGPRPGVLVVHQWLGITTYEKHRAEMLAQLGYVAFCADIYGKGMRPKDPAEAGAEAAKYKSNRPLLRERVKAGLDELKKSELVDK